jgi:4-hydroxybenzoate polyprenyltransferase
LRARIWRIIEAWRIGRVIMMALVTGATAYGFGASTRSVALASLSASFLALSGFYLDDLADWRKDRASGKLLNPIASGELSPRTALVLIIVSVSASAFLGFITHPCSLLPLSGVLLIVGGLGIGVLDTPVLRAVSLGTIQGLYVLLGALAANYAGWAAILSALFLLFAMTGGKVMGDVRDLRHDSRARTMTIPRKYGLRWASAFLLINEALAYLVALSVYATGALRIGYLYCILGIVLAGTAINLLFVSRPTPNVADLTNKLSLGVLGMLFVVGMVLGRM